MSLIIKGMSLPSGCNMCQLHVLCFDYYVCRAKKLESGGYLDVDDQVIAGIRHRCCPLVEIPTPHGRLIDENELLRHEYGFSQTARVIIKTTDAVIEAEVSE